MDAMLESHPGGCTGTGHAAASGTLKTPAQKGDISVNPKKTLAKMWDILGD
jgi:hypothetical protein